MALPRDVSPKVSFSPGHIYVTVDSETFDIDPAMFLAERTTIDHLLHNIRTSLKIQGINAAQNPAAAIAYVQGRTYKVF